ncbi:hypothetical protein C8R43DRAFT_86021 [Mycena crocata]|nr:hypothetical protein C8R43DRAFT_86021 [Mycena crocata]
MSSTNGNNFRIPQNASVYYTAVPIVAVVLVAIAAAIYFRMRRGPIGPSVTVRLRNRGRDNDSVELGEKPQLFDVYVGDLEEGVETEGGAGKDSAQQGWDWDDIMPLSLMDFTPSSRTTYPPPRPGKRVAGDKTPGSDMNSDLGYASVLVGVMVRMPGGRASPAAPATPQDAAPRTHTTHDDEVTLPHLELGCTNVEVLRGADDMGPGLTPS